MANANVKALCESTKDKLKSAISQLESFLNANALPQLVTAGEDTEHYYKGLLSDLRHLIVYTETNYDKLAVALKRTNFDTDQAEHHLYSTYHQCVSAFYYPKNECYSEDGRYAYTGQDAIIFRQKPTEDVRYLVLSLSKLFEELRDDLAYYETEYMTRRKMQTR